MNNGYPASVRRILALALVAAGLLAVAQVAPPLAVSDLVELLEGGVTPSRAATLVRERGVAFALTEGAEHQIRLAGGNDTLLLAIAQSKKYGSLEVTVNVGGEVFLDGARQAEAEPGKALLQRYVPAGPHKLEVKRSGHETFSETITIEAGRMAQKTVTLAREIGKISKDLILLPASMGAVRFAHKTHAKELGINCENCHHASRPEKPSIAGQQACSECHGKTAAAPMKTRLQAAFHDSSAKSGLCIDCHRAEKAKGKKAPGKCMDCHQAGESSPVAELSRAFQTIYIGSSTWLTKPGMVEGAFHKYPEFEAWGLAIVENRAAGDTVLEVDHQPGWFYYTYRFVHQGSGVVLAAGKVTAWDGKAAAEKIAEEIVKRLKRFRALPEQPKEKT